MDFNKSKKQIHGGGGKGQTLSFPLFFHAFLVPSPPTPHKKKKLPQAKCIFFHKFIWLGGYVAGLWCSYDFLCCRILSLAYTIHILIFR